jgi:hypothetical protein
MKVAVFGDSYADENTNTNVGYKSWVELLREKYYPDLTCYGLSSTSVYYSYDLFLKHHESYDKIIFLSSTYHRITIPNYIKFKDTPAAELRRHINSLDMAEHNLKNTEYMTEESILATKAVIEYYKYLHDEIKDKRYCKLMKANIKKIRPDSALIDTIPPGLSVVAFHEFNAIGLRREDMGKYRDIRRCHLSKRNNEILADKMFEWSNGTPVTIDVNDFEVPSKEELERLIFPL